LSQSDAAEPFNADHVVARQHSGPTREENLAFACARCNRHKGPNVAGVEPETGRIVPLFNPRRDDWHTHFRWDGALLHGVTATGRVTIHVLDMNHPDRVLLRSLLIELGVFPPKAIE
jgi:hypothetical protein